MQCIGVNISDFRHPIMETKGAKGKRLNSQLEYLRRKPLLDKASSEFDTDWVEKVVNKETVDPNTLPLKDKHALPTQRQVLLLFHFFRNIDRTSKKSVIAEKMRQCYLLSQMPNPQPDVCTISNE